MGNRAAEPVEPSAERWIEFSGDWDYDHPALIMTTLAFYAGQTRLLSATIADAAIAAGVAIDTTPPAEEPEPLTEEHAEGE